VAGRLAGEVGGGLAGELGGGGWRGSGGGTWRGSLAGDRRGRIRLTNSSKSSLVFRLLLSLPQVEVAEHV
jgi:hypothetical protein